MNRREFATVATVTVATASAAALLVPTACQAAEPAPVEGTHYVKLGRPAPVAAPAGQVEVVEFFWYGCPHCFHFEPALEAWVNRLPKDVVFRRIPVAFRERPFAMHQRLYFALEAMGLLPKLHSKVFHAMHVDKLTLDSPELIADFIARQGVDKNKFMGMFNAFSMPARLAQARTLSEEYKIDGVPTLGIGGRYFTSVSLNGTPDKTLATADFLIGTLRNKR
jgi:protein dithiol oxidoreductase (disulfide-forming)